MKKSFLFSMCLCLFLSTFAFTFAASADAKSGIAYPYTPKEGSIEELYKDMLVTTIEPILSTEIQKQYGLPLLYGLSDVDFLEVDREAYRSFSFTLTVEVRPFVGAHNTIGVDKITLSISPYGTKVLNFKHKESFPLPPHKQNAYPDLKMPPLS